MSNRTHVAEIEEHKVKTGETLDTVAAANGLTKDDLAKFNFGTADPAQVNQHLRDDVGCTRQDARGDFIFDDNDDPGIILVPKQLKLSGLATNQQHTLRVCELSPSRNLHKCVCIPGITFEFDKSFIRPSVVPHMEKLDAALAEFPDAQLIVFGHTDRVGSEQYNKELSERRAKSAYAFITDQTAIWEELYNQENWGVIVIQETLLDLGHDPGPIDGVMGSKTEAAMREFQGLPPNAPVSNNAAFRAKLFLAYMTGKHDVHVDDARFFAPKFMGCGEFNPLVEPNANELANRSPGNEPNRRVVFYLFKRPPPNIPCKLRNLAPCKAEIAKPGERKNPLHKCAFYDGIAVQCKCEQGGSDAEQTSHIALFVRSNSSEVPLANQPYKIFVGGGVPLVGETDDKGFLKHEQVPAGDYELEIAGKHTVTVPTIPTDYPYRIQHVPEYML